MSKTLTIICALALIVGFTTIAKAEVQNVKVGGDITTYGVFREDYDLDSSASTDETATTEESDAAWYQTTTRLQIDADLTDNVAATIRLLNERDWGVSETVATTDIDLDLAYITLKEMLYSPMTLTIGRQELADLTDLVVGDPDTNDSETVGAITANDLSARKSFDAIRADLDYAPWTLTLLAAKIDDSDVTGTTPGTSEDLYGVNAAYNFAQYNANAEGYVFYDDRDKADADAEVIILGVKGAMEPRANLTLAGELAIQDGDFDSDSDQDAWALDLSGNYIWADNPYRPNIGLAYIFRSGDGDNLSPGSGTTDAESWDPMFENQTHGIVANAILGGNNEGADSNAQIIKLSGGFVPVETVTVGLDYLHYILDEEFSAGTYSFTGGSYTMDNDDDLGDEIDLSLTYDYTEDVQFGLAYGLFMPGDAFDDSNDDDASQLLGSVKVVF